MAAPATWRGVHKALHGQPLYLVLGVLLGVLLTRLTAPPGSSRQAAAINWLGGAAAADGQPAAPYPAGARMGLRDWLPWEPLLTHDEVQRALGYYGTGHALRRVAAKLLAGQPIQVVMLGGSITRGTGASTPAAAYSSRFFQLLNATFPHRDHVFLNQGIGGTTSTIFAACMEQLVPPDADLVTLEFTWNDEKAGGYDRPSRRAFEQLLRLLLRLPEPPALVLLHHYAWGAAGKLFYYPPEQQLSTFAHYYDIPVVSMRGAVYRLMAAGIDGFRVDKVVPSKPANTSQAVAVEGERDRYFYADFWLHPSNQGHKAMAEALAGPLMRAVGEAAAGQLEQPSSSNGGGSSSSGGGSSRQDPRLEGLPPPMVPGNTELTTISCAIQKGFEGVVRNASGFEYRAERPGAAGFVAQKWSWSGYNPGDWAELELDTRALDATPPHEKVVLWLAHLKSYEHMGTADVQCTSGCTCRPSKLDGTTPHRISLLMPFIFEVTQHPQCRIRVTIAAQAGQHPSGEHKVVLAAVVVAAKGAPMHPWR